jgi:hypothetical protein
MFEEDGNSEYEYGDGARGATERYGEGKEGEGKEEARRCEAQQDDDFQGGHWNSPYFQGREQREAHSARMGPRTGADWGNRDWTSVEGAQRGMGANAVGANAMGAHAVVVSGGGGYAGGGTVRTKLELEDARAGLLQQQERWRWQQQEEDQKEQQEVPMVASASMGGDVCVWDLRSNTTAIEFLAGTATIAGIFCTPSHTPPLLYTRPLQVYSAPPLIHPPSHTPDYCRYILARGAPACDRRLGRKCQNLRLAPHEACQSSAYDIYWI